MNKRVAIVYPSTFNWMNQCMDGIRRYSRERGNWYLLSSPPALRGVGGALSLGEMRGWKGDGIIALLDDVRELGIARSMGIPVVNLGARLPHSFGIPRVLVNNRKCGRLAADHLLSRGLKHLAVFGWKGAWYANERCIAFSERTAEAGVTCEVFLRDPKEEGPKNWTQRVAEPARWLATLPRPCGVFAIHDYMAQLLLEACHEVDLRVPDDIAVIGMDNDEPICEHSAPTLTSISRNSEQLGWEAAMLLDRLMGGDIPSTNDLFIDPDGVVARQSTDLLHCDDPLVQQALEFMRRNLTAPCNIAHIAEHAGVSKRTLETRFRESLQRSPHEYLTTLRVQHAQTLIRSPENKLTLRQAAAACGFMTIRTFYAAYKRVTGESLDSSRFAKDA
jgi:LacI family transcriptional regulator